MTEPEIRSAYHLHKDAIYRFAWRMAGSTAAAEDIVQECFLSLLRNPAGYESRARAATPFPAGDRAQSRAEALAD
jgi:DNA-directed RNA polymerase specialized sigma24 family protein